MAKLGFKDLADATVEDREEYARRLFEECVRYRQASKEAIWVDEFRYFRALADDSSIYKARMRHPVAFPIMLAIHSMLYPVFLSSDPPFQLDDANPANRDRNQCAEQVIAAQLRHPQRSNFRPAWDDVLLTANVFGTAAPWTGWRTETRNCGPFYEPVLSDLTGLPLYNADGGEAVRETYKALRVYHGPWLEHFDLWDTYLHPDGRRGLSFRDVSGHELLARSQGASPCYDPVRVNRMLKEEAMSLRRSGDPRMGGFSAGDDFMQDRDALAEDAGASPRREYRQSDPLIALENVLDRTYPIAHMDDPMNTGAYAVNSGGRFFELRFASGASPDGQGNRLLLRTHTSPGEVYGIGLLEEMLPLLKSLSGFFRAANDAAALTVNPVWVGSTKFKDANGGLTVGPGVILEAPTSGDQPLDNHIKRLDMPQTWVAGMQFADVLMKHIDLVSGQGPYTRGQTAGARTTAFEMSALTSFTEGRGRMLHERVVHQFGIPLIRKMLCLNATHLTPKDYQMFLGPKSNVYKPPTVEEIVESLMVIPKGSLESANASLRQARWQGVLQTLITSLPYLKMRPVNEAFKRWLEDMDIEAVSRLLPIPDDTIPTEFQAMIAAGKGGAGGVAAAPKSPTDMSAVMRGAGGAMAPPGPMNGQGFGGNGETGGY